MKLNWDNGMKLLTIFQRDVAALMDLPLEWAYSSVLIEYNNGMCNVSDIPDDPEH